jgi:hypothetical protein
MTLEMTMFRPRTIMRHSRSAHDQWPLWLPALVPALSLPVVGLLAASRVDIATIGDTGLAARLPLVYWVCLGLVTSTLVVLLWVRQTPSWVLGGFLASVLALVPGLGVVLYGSARGAVSLRHTGIVDNLTRIGWPDRAIDAYFNWPGFFSLSSYVNGVLGLSGPQSMLRWAPLAFGLLSLPMVYILSGTFTDDRRVHWLAMLVVTLANWTNQDYFAPQAFGFLLYLLVLVVVLRFDPLSPPSLDNVVNPERGRERLLVYLTVVVICLALVPMHQLTPFALLLTLVALTTLRRTRIRALPGALALSLGTWVTYVAAPFFSGHLRDMLQDAGFETVASANVVSRLSGSPGHQLVVQLRLSLVLVLWLIFLAALLVRWRRDGWSWELAIGFAAPFVLLPMQPYGGEMLIRVFLLSLPFVGVGVAWLAARVGTSPWRAVLLIAPLATALAVTGVATRYGNDRANIFTQGDLAAVNRMYDLAEPGSLLVAADTNTPWKHRNYEAHDYELLSTVWRTNENVEFVMARLRHQFRQEDKAPFVVVTASNVKSARLFGSIPVAALEQIQDQLRSSPDFLVVVNTTDALVVKYVGPLGEES